MLQLAVLRCCIIGLGRHYTQGESKENINQGPIHEILLLATQHQICSNPFITREFSYFK